MYFLLDGEHIEQRVAYRVCSEVSVRESWLNAAAAIGGALCKYYSKCGDNHWQYVGSQ